MLATRSMDRDQVARMVTVGCRTRHLTTLGALWSLPNTLIGLGFAALSLALPRPRAGLLGAHSDRGLAYLFLTRRGFGAITFWRVVVRAIPITPRLLPPPTHHSRQHQTLRPS